MKYPDDYINKIICGDCLDVMKGIPDNSIDMVLTSPPYDELKEYNGYKFNFQEIAKQMYRTIKTGGSLVWVVNDATINGSETCSSFKQAIYFKGIGFKLHDTMIWHKPNCFNFGSNKCYRNSFEYMFVFSKGSIKEFNLIKDVPTKSNGKTLKGARKHSNGTRDIVPDFTVGEFKKRDNVWDINVNCNNNGHPAVFPEALASNHIISWSKSGDTILDPFMGSGTTLKMARKNNRNFIGIDVSPEYCEIAERRLSQEYLFT